jgi:hypothetical protein
METNSSLRRCEPAPGAGPVLLILMDLLLRVLEAQMATSMSRFRTGCATVGPGDNRQGLPWKLFSHL